MKENDNLGQQMTHRGSSGGGRRPRVNLNAGFDQKQTDHKCIEQPLALTGVKRRKYPRSKTLKLVMLRNRNKMQT